MLDRPEEIDDYIKIIFEEYAKDGDTGALLSSLRVLSRVKGVTKIAEEAGNPEFSSVNSIIHAMGYQLAPQKIDSSTNL